MDIRRTLRSTRAARQVTSLDGPAAPPVFLADLPEAGEALLLDTCVYIDQLQGRLPRAVEARITARNVFHSSLSLAELSFPFGRLDPTDSRTGPALQAIEALMASIPERRLLTPTPETKMRGAILAGVMARVLGYGDAQRRKALMDAMIAAQAAREGLLLVTRNLADFERLSRLAPKLKWAVYQL